MNYAIILAGGIGSRFWPLSREYLPKQFLKVIKKDTLLEATIKRIGEIIPKKNIYIVTGKIYLREIKKCLLNFNIPRKNIILEPSPKNTLPAIGLCAQIINSKDPESNLLILPSDHYIKDNSNFRQTVLKALGISLQGPLCLIGIRPVKPHSGYGYIKIGKNIRRGIFQVKSFQEKPKTSEASMLFKRKDTFWNSGIFSFSSETILGEIRKYMPKLYNQLAKIRRQQDIAALWGRISPISIDYGILQKSKNLVMVQGNFFWCDLGSWDAICDILPKDKNNNIILSDYVGLHSRDILVCSNNSQRLITTIGLEGIIIVDTPDALLVCKKENSQDIRRLVQFLRKKRKTCV